MSAPDDDTLRAILEDFARATAKRPPCEAGLDPDACEACIAWTTEALEAGVRLWGIGRGPGTVTALAAEVLRLRDAARAHLAADDALSLARRTDAADVPAAEARALAARECLARLVGYVPGEVGR